MSGKLFLCETTLSLGILLLGATSAGLEIYSPWGLIKITNSECHFISKSTVEHCKIFKAREQCLRAQELVRVNNNASFLKNIALKTLSKADHAGSCIALGGARGSSACTGHEVA